MSIFTAFIQHYNEGYNQYNKVRNKIRYINIRKQEVKGRRWHDYLCGKSDGIYKEATKKN